MSKLIDTFYSNKDSVSTEINGKWYVAKPLYYKPSIINRLRDCIRVLKCKSYAYHFKEDE